MKYPPTPPRSLAARGSPVFEGELSVLGLGEVVQMICAGRQRLWVEVWLVDERKGALGVADGDVVGCATMGYGGDRAFLLLAQQQRGKFKVYEATVEELATLPRTERSWQELVLESARLSDESGREGEAISQEIARPESSAARSPDGREGVLIPFPARASEPSWTEVDDVPSVPTARVPVADEVPAKPTPSASQPEVAPVEPPSLVPSEPLSVVEPVGGGQGVDALLARATEAYLRRDYPEALRLFTECLALRPGDRGILHNIERLKKRGK